VTATGNQPQAGFFGKLPSRGDFLRAGLPRSFVQPWDGWWQTAIAGSRAVLREIWVDAWMEAPIWRFCLPAGQCGPDAVLGVWIPSVDRAGRHFPLTMALVANPETTLQSHAGWLTGVEAAGLAALEHDLEPDALAAEITAALDLPPEALLPDLTPITRGHAIWWTEGAPRVPATTLILPDLPGVPDFAAMLHAHADAPRDPVMPAIP